MFIASLGAPQNFHTPKTYRHQPDQIRCKTDSGVEIDLPPERNTMRYGRLSPYKTPHPCQDKGRRSQTITRPCRVSNCNHDGHGLRRPHGKPAPRSPHFPAPRPLRSLYPTSHTRCGPSWLQNENGAPRNPRPNSPPPRSGRRPRNPKRKPPPRKTHLPPGRPSDLTCGNLKAMLRQILADNGDLKRQVAALTA